ncbi:MAG: hypothetical protein WC842_03360 [Candidatus Paceibacterota bacterium]|jgi:hypothetical protein
MKLEKLIDRLDLDYIDGMVNEESFPVQKEDKGKKISVLEIFLTILFVFGTYFCLTDGDIISGLSIVGFYLYSLRLLSKENKKEYQLFHFEKIISSKDVITEMNKAGSRPATLREMLRWAFKNWDRKIPIVALQQRSETNYIAMLSVFINVGLFAHVALSEWASDCRFLAVKK